MKPSFGWVANARSDGFEQEHGRFTMEVFWHEKTRSWGWRVWADAMVNGQHDQVVLAVDYEVNLDSAKRSVLQEASILERAAISEDKKFR